MKRNLYRYSPSEDILEDPYEVKKRNAHPGYTWNNLSRFTVGTLAYYTILIEMESHISGFHTFPCLFKLYNLIP